MYTTPTPQDVLRHSVSTLPNFETEIQQIITQKGSKTQKETDLRNLITTVVGEAMADIMTVDEYEQRQASKQVVSLYVGTHWVLLHGQQQQLFVDFVREAAGQIGLPQEYIIMPAFMNPLIEQIAFSLSAYHETYLPGATQYINLLNGTLEIRPDGTTHLRPHRASDMFRYVLPFAYDPGATCPLTQQFLSEVLPEEEARELIGEYLGWSITGARQRLERALCFYGGGSNGKSVLTGLIAKLAGDANVSYMELSEITTNEEKRAQLEHKLLNLSPETRKEIDATIFKQLVSGEAVPVRNYYHSTRTMTHYARIIASFNQLPKAEQTHGWWRRFILVPFDVTITEERQDKQLGEKLEAELPGFLNWVLQCFVRLIQRGRFIDSPACNKALHTYRISSNSALYFLETQCAPSDDARMPVKQLYKAYTDFCYDEGIKSPLSSRVFRNMLAAAGHEQRKSHGLRYYALQLKPEED